MISDKLENMVRGWFVGAFTPSIMQTDEFEVAVQHFKAGDHEPKHVHKIATEITVILTGQARMAGQEWAAGSIVRMEAGEPTDFFAITDVVTLVVKTPSAPNDKYLV